MKKTKIFIGVIASAAILFSGFCLQNYYKEKNDTPKFASTTVSSEDGLAVIAMDSKMNESIKNMTNDSDIVVEGKVIKKTTNSRNLERNPLNPNEESKTGITMSQEYEFEVTNWMKGSGDKRINIVYPDYTELKGKKISNENAPLIEGKEYVLFLESGIDNTYYGSGEPWQFKINSETGKFDIVTNVKGIKIKDLDSQDFKELKTKVGKYNK